MIEPSFDRYTRYCDIIRGIDDKLLAVHEETAFSSSHTPILQHPDFNWLVEQGDKIIPYLFHVITHRGCNWVILLLLTRISPVSPVKNEHRGQFYHIIYDWLGWYLESGYRERDDIYHGLIDVNK